MSNTEARMNTPERPLKSQAARDAQAANYGGPSYWAYLDEAAQELYEYYMSIGDPENAKRMFTRSLADALRGNEGD